MKLRISLLEAEYWKEKGYYENALLMLKTYMELAIELQIDASLIRGNLREMAEIGDLIKQERRHNSGSFSNLVGMNDHLPANIQIDSGLADQICEILDSLPADYSSDVADVYNKLNIRPSQLTRPRLTRTDKDKK